MQKFGTPFSDVLTPRVVLSPKGGKERVLIAFLGKTVAQYVANRCGPLLINSSRVLQSR